MTRILRRIAPPEGVETKLDDLVTYEVVFDDGTLGTISTHVTEFDLNIKKTKSNFMRKSKITKILL